MSSLPCNRPTLWFKKTRQLWRTITTTQFQSILIIFSKLFVNDHKSCLVVKFFTSPHLCCHYTLWNTTLYFALITLLIAKIRVLFGWLWKESVIYWSRCSNWRPFAFTHVRSRAVHWSTAWSTTHCGMLAHVSTRHFFKSIVSRTGVLYRRCCIRPQMR